MTKTTNLKIAEIKTALRGRRYQFYSGWNGTFRTFIIQKVKRYNGSKNYYQIFGVSDRNPDFKYDVVVTKECMADLISCGHHEKYNELDHCAFRDHYKIF